MTADDYQRAAVLFDQLRHLPNDARASALDAACPDNSVVRAQVLRLLEADLAASGAQFLDRPAIEDAAGLIPPDLHPAFQEPGENVGTVIDRYQLQGLIGEGGMGEVWLADQTEPVRRRVALKLVKAGMNTREVIARFESERQALALMDHPAIAKVLDAGSTPRGTPYFVMEYIGGVPITSYCDNHQLTIRDRLEIFLRVCEGVQHAHQKAILHRDLKPSNILITEVDGRPAPKIIDFGVAKALSQKLTADTMFTQVGALIGTPAYMSPEQADPAEDIDTRTDVYSLGILLYELLTGAAPLEVQGITLHEFLRRLRDEEAQRPSTRIRTQDPNRSADAATKRGTEPRALANEVQGDLDWIALKALEKERSRRYGSPFELAADLTRFLTHEPVLAAPPSTVYRARKFARRYRLPLATVSAFVLVLLGAAAFSIRQRIRADAEAAVAQAVNEFLQNDLLAQASAFAQAGPAVKPDPELKVRTALDRAAARIGERFDRQPEVEAAIRDTIGQTYLDLGLYTEAQTQLDRTLDLRRRVLGPEHPKTLKTRSRFARIAFMQGSYPRAEEQYRDLLDFSRRVVGPEHPDTLSVMAGLALTYRVQAKFAHAEPLQAQTLEIQRRVLGKEHPDTLMSLGNLAIVHYQLGHYAEAEQLYRQALEIQTRVRGPEHPDTLRSMGNLAINCIMQGKYAEAEGLLQRTFEIRKLLLGAEHAQTLSSMNNLAGIYFTRGNYGAAEDLYRQASEIHRRRFGPEHPDTLMYMNNLALAYDAQGKDAPAEDLFHKTLESRRRVLGPEHPFTLSTLSFLAFMHQRRSDYAEAESYAAQALAGLRRKFGPDNPETTAAISDLALAHCSQGEFAQCEQFASEAAEIQRKKRPEDWQRFRAEALLGASLAGKNNYEEAEPLLLAGHKGMTERKGRMRAIDQYHIEVTRDWIEKLYQVWVKPGKAAAWRRK